MSKVWDFFKEAGRIAILREDKRSFYLASIGIRGDGAMVKATNAPSQERSRYVHCEHRLAKKLDVGATVFVVRVKANGEFGMAKPCEDCQKILRFKGVKKVYYTVNNNEYKIMVP